MDRALKPLVAVAAAVVLAACGQPPAEESAAEGPAAATEQQSGASQLLAKYTPFRLTTDLSVLSENERKMIPLLIEAAEAMDDAFWIQAHGDKDGLLASISDPRPQALRRGQLRSVGPPGGRGSLRGGGRRQAPGSHLLSHRHDQGRARGGGRIESGAQQ